MEELIIVDDNGNERSYMIPKEVMEYIMTLENINEFIYLN
jgi:hypothetical protein